jgi:hypothetical protein
MSPNGREKIQFYILKVVSNLIKIRNIYNAPGEEFTNRCLVSILNRSSNELRNNFASARPTSKQRNHCLESWYAPIVS